MGSDGVVGPANAVGPAKAGPYGTVTAGPAPPGRSPVDGSTSQTRRGLRQPSDRNNADPYAALRRAAGRSAHGRGAPPRSRLRSIAAAPSDATAAPSPDAAPPV